MRCLMAQNNSINRSIVALVIALSCSQGCVRVEKKINPRDAKMCAYLRLETVKEGIKNGSIKLGMRRKELAYLLGKPDRVIQVETDRNFDEQWIYADKTSSEPKYFAFQFQDDALIGWQ